MVRRFPARSATISSSPIGVSRRSIKKANGSTMGSHPEMLGGIGMPRPPGGGDVVLAHDKHRLALPVTGRAQAGTLGNQRCKLGIAREVAADGGDVGAQIEHTSHPAA